MRINLASMAIRISGTIRVAEDMYTYELPFASGMNLYKWENKVPNSGKEALRTVLRDYDSKLELEDNLLRFNIPYSSHQEFEMELEDLVKLSKDLKKALNVKKLEKFPIVKKQKRQKVEEKEKAPVDDEEEKVVEKKKKEKKKKLGRKKRGLQIEVPVRLDGLIDFLKMDDKIEEIVKEFKGGKIESTDESILLNFPDEDLQDEIIRKIEEVVGESTFYSKVFDV